MDRNSWIKSQPGWYFIWLGWLLVLAAPLGSLGQARSSNGAPFIKNYRNNSILQGYGSWNLIQDNDGILYFGTNSSSDNILQFDGVTWKGIKSPSSSRIVRCFAKDDKGTVYYGGSGDFGYLSKDDKGNTVEHSLLEFVPKDQRNFYDIWSIHPTPEGVYFQSRERLFRMTRSGSGKAENWNTRSWEPTTHFMYSFYLDGMLYVHEQGVGILKMADDSLVFIAGSEPLGKDRVQVMLPYPSRSSAGGPSYLLGTFNHGLYLYDGKNFTPFACQADSIIHHQILYKGLVINGNYVLSVLGYGLVIMDPQGRTLEVINRNSGLLSDVVYGMYLDYQNSLWLSLDNEVARVEINSPFTRFNAQSGITEIPVSAARAADGELYVGTNNGLLKFDSATSRFHFVNQMPRDQIFQILRDGNSLLIPANGLYMIRDHKVTQVISSNNNTLQLARLAISKKYPKVMLIGSTSGMSVVLRDPSSSKGWKFEGNLSEVKGEIHNIAESPDGSFWVLNQIGVAFHITLSMKPDGSVDLAKTEVTSYPVLPGTHNNISTIFKLNNQVYFVSDSAEYAYNPETRKFSPALFEGYSQFLGSQDTSGKFTLSVLKGGEPYKAYIGTPLPGGKYTLDSTSLLPLIGVRMGGVYLDKNGVIWFFTADGLIRFDGQVKENILQPYRTLITAIGSDTLRFNPNPAAEEIP
ncbi:MAG: hypothetical protein KGM98_07360, partial [Bacteroidota bacterium]|nr:hypothetical protein [Bacteroidota bacterium]